jgi:hypothetical protein
MATSLQEVGGDLNEAIEVQSCVSPSSNLFTNKQEGTSSTNSYNHGFLTRCTSTPLNRGLVEKEFLSPYDVPNRVDFDSGFESDLSRSTPIITRSRSRQWSGPALAPTLGVTKSLSTSSSSLASISSHASSATTVSLISFDLRKFPSTSVKDQDIGKRIVFRPGLFEHMEFLDIIKRLNDRGTQHILTNIWQYLSGEEIGKAMQVSAHWNAAILSDRDTIDRYVEAKEIAMDQNTQSHKHICSRLKNAGPRKALGTLNLIESPVKPREQQRRSPRLANSPNGNSKRKNPHELTAQIVSPSKFRHKLFTEAADGLGPDEKLQPCPRCTSPCKIVPNENKGLCSRISCQFHFCTLCYCLYHSKETPCRLVRDCKIKTISPPNSSPPETPAKLSGSISTSSKARVASKQSKRRLKRLLLH